MIRWDDFVRAIEGGEAVPDGKGGFKTSVQGARGPRQMMPATFKQYAKPGESIDNPEDNRAVSDRFIYALWKQHGGDARKMAAAYFSGRPDYTSLKTDAYGTTVREYVGNVIKRLNPVQQAQASETGKNRNASATAWSPPEEAFGSGGWSPPEEAFSAQEAPAKVSEQGSGAVPADTVPYQVRIAVGSAPPEGREATLQKYYPDAKITPYGGDNWIITQKGGQKMIYNPPGFDSGDIASLAPEAAEGVGGLIGAIAGAGGGLPGSAAGAGIGAALGKELFQKGMALAGYSIDPRSVGATMGDMMVTGLLNSGGEITGEMLSAGGKALVRTMFRGGKTGLRQFQQAVKDADAWGIKISVGEAGDNAWRTFDQFAPKAAQDAREGMAAAARDGLAELSNTFSQGRATSYPAIGRVIEQAAKDFRASSNATGRALDQVFYQELPPSSPILMTNTEAAIKRIIPDLQSMPGMTQSLQQTTFGRQMQQLSSDINLGLGTLQMADVRSYRQVINDMVPSGGETQLVGDISLNQLKDLRAALSHDLRDAAVAAGPTAEAAWTRSQEHWAKALRLRDEILQPLINKNVPSEIAKGLEGKLSATKGAPEYIDGLFRVMTKDQKDIIRAGVVAKLGYNTPSKQGAEGVAWSFDKFLKDWNGLDKQVRNKLFKGTGYTQDLDALARTSEAIQRSTQGGTISPYMTARTVGTAVSVGAGLGAVSGGAGWFVVPAGFALTYMGSRGGQLLMRNPAFVHWLAQATTASAKGVGPAIGRLTAIAKNSDPDTGQAIQEFLSSLAGQQDGKREQQPIE